MRYVSSPYRRERRITREVVVGDPGRGGIVIGGRHPIVVQSMITCDTMDTAACVEQTTQLVEAGCQLVRITAPTVKDAANLRAIVEGVRSKGVQVPFVADIHFKPEAAMEAARWVEKVRINPGNYADSKKFAVRDYTDDQYASELARIEEKFVPLVDRCRELGRAMRIGTNHGSLSDRIMNRFGDTPLGMVESALEFARIARNRDYHNFVFSMKASSPAIMIQCYRLLVARLAELGSGWEYPIHLGVTEAGEGEDGRVKSAIGIGSLLLDGLGDTIRVSLTEDSPHEIPVCRDLLSLVSRLSSAENSLPEIPLSYDPFEFVRRTAREIALASGERCGGEQPVRVLVTQSQAAEIQPRLRPRDDVRPEGIYESEGVVEIDPREAFQLETDERLVTVRDGVDAPTVAAFRLLAARLAQMGRSNPILLKDQLRPDASREPQSTALLEASAVIGALLSDGIGDAVLVRGADGGGLALRRAYTILQAAGRRSFKTDYVACPSCGRTLFDLQTVTGRIKIKTEHLKGVKIAVMGCIVNGPGEMADADFGYVGGAPGKVNLYVGKKPVKFNIPEAEAVDRLVDLIQEHGKWADPVAEEATA